MLMIMTRIFYCTIAISAIVVGLKALCGGGILLTRNKALTGVPAMVAGILCILLGVGMFIWPVILVAILTKDVPPTAAADNQS